MHLTRSVASFFACSLIFSLHSASAQYGAPQGPPSGYQQGQGGWDNPPAEYADDLQRRAFHDGIESARQDFQNHRAFDPATHDQFRHPHVPFPARDTYREAYKRGYFMAVKHLQGQQGAYGAPPPPQQGYQPQPGGWETPPSEYADDLQRRAFHDGIETARSDFQNNRPSDPAAHEEFRHPQVPFPARDTYRQAYKRGYFTAMQHLRGGGPGGPR